MAKFQYKAVDGQGNIVTDIVMANNREAVIEQLCAEGYYPSEIKTGDDISSTSRSFTGGVSKGDVEIFIRELSNLLAAGVSLSKALSILSRESKKHAAKKVWASIHDHVVGGMTLADSLNQWPKLFPAIYVAMVRAGETGGFLDLVLSQIAEFRSREQDLKSKVKSALVYPVVLAVLATLILFFLLVYFIPRFSSIFAEFGGTLPPLTNAIVLISDAAYKYWFLIIAVIAAVILAMKNLLKRKEGKETYERMLLKIPMIGKLSARFAFVRFSRMLGTLVQAGVPLISALQAAKEAIGNETLSTTVTGAIEKVRRGMPLGRSLSESAQLFPGSVIEMISVAEESGRIDDELIRLANTYEKELDRNLKMAISMAEPLMLFIMAALVGTVVIGMLLPIFNLQDLIR